MQIYNAHLTTLSTKEIKRYAGINVNTPFPEAMLTKAKEEALVFAEPRACWQIFPYDSHQGLILAAHQMQISSCAAQKHLFGAKEIIILTATVGEEIEKIISEQFSAGNYQIATLIDAAATTAVEAVADKVTAFLCSHVAKNGSKIGARFSPGYSDWQLSYQPLLLKLTGANEIGIFSNESHMLMPRKSITAVIGVYPKGVSIPSQKYTNQKNNCLICEKEFCIAKKTAE